jgi:hypothetical protein
MFWPQTMAETICSLARTISALAVQYLNPQHIILSLCRSLFWYSYLSLDSSTYLLTRAVTQCLFKVSLYGTNRIKTIKYLRNQAGQLEFSVYMTSEKDHLLDY